MRGSEGRGPLSFAPICNELFLLHPSVTPLCQVPLLSLLPHAEHLCESSDSSVLPLPQPNCPPPPPGPTPLQHSCTWLQEDIAAAGQVVETTRDPMFRDPKTNKYLG